KKSTNAFRISLALRGLIDVLQEPRGAALSQPATGNQWLRVTPVTWDPDGHPRSPCRHTERHSPAERPACACVASSIAPCPDAASRDRVRACARGCARLRPRAHSLRQASSVQPILDMGRPPTKDPAIFSEPPR